MISVQFELGKCHRSGSGMSTEGAISKLLACLTVVTKPLRAPKPCGRPALSAAPRGP